MGWLRQMRKLPTRVTMLPDLGLINGKGVWTLHVEWTDGTSDTELIECRSHYDAIGRATIRCRVEGGTWAPHGHGFIWRRP